MNKVKSKNNNLNASIHNKFEIEVIDVNTGEIKQKAQAFNIICDQLWVRLFGKSSYFSSIHFGVGSGTPSAHDSSLFSFLGGMSATNTTVSMNHYDGVYSCKKSIQLVANSYVGSTITEVGIGYDSNSGSLCTHAMLQDMDGNPTSITKTDIDVVNIYATIYIHFNPEGYDNGSIWFVHLDSSYSILRWLSGYYDYEYTIPGCVYIGTGRGSLFDSHNSIWPEGEYTRYGGVSTECDALTKTITFTIPRIAAEEVTSTNTIGCIILASNTYHEYVATYSYVSMLTIMVRGGDWYPYSEIKGEVAGTGDGVITDFPLTYPFAHDAKVYVDSLEVTEGVTVYHAPNTTSDWLSYMDGLRDNSTPDKHIIRCFCPTSSQTNAILYNPMYSVGIRGMYGTLKSVYASNDLENWVEMTTYTSGSYSTRTYNFDEEYVHYKYWKYTGELDNVYPVDTYTGNVIHFDTPPEINAHISVDYKSDCIIKDENHVLDFSLTIQLGEYVEENSEN